jgi:hypothetical protein
MRFDPTCNFQPGGVTACSPPGAEGPSLMETKEGSSLGAIRSLEHGGSSAPPGV